MIAHDDRDVMTLAQTLWGEAHGEPEEGKAVVAWVIVNRDNRVRFAGGGAGSIGAIARVCLAPWQFSCWNAADPNRAKLLALKPAKMAIEMKIVVDVLGAIPDPTNGADHYHTIDAPGGPGSAEIGDRPRATFEGLSMGRHRTT